MSKAKKVQLTVNFAESKNYGKEEIHFETVVSAVPFSEYGLCLNCDAVQSVLDRLESQIQKMSDLLAACDTALTPNQVRNYRFWLATYKGYELSVDCCDSPMDYIAVDWDFTNLLQMIHEVEYIKSYVAEEIGRVSRT